MAQETKKSSKFMGKRKHKEARCFHFLGQLVKVALFFVSLGGFGVKNWESYDKLRNKDVGTEVFI